MTRDEIEDRVSKTISDSLQVSPEKITPSARLVEDLDIDSLFVVQLVMELEDQFKLQVADEDIVKFKTVADIIDYIGKKVGAE